MRSWRRGTREMDLILGPFADARIGDMDRDTRAAYEGLLEENDRDLYAWVAGQLPPPERHEGLIARIRRFHDLG